MFYSDDPAADYDRYDAHQERLRARLPVCENKRCGKRIDEDDYYDVQGEILCEDCMKEKYRRYTADLLEI